MDNQDLLLNLDDDIDVDLLADEIDDILNENEPDLAPPDHSFRSAQQFQLDSLKSFQEDQTIREMLSKLDNSPNKPTKVDPLDLIHQKEIEQSTQTDKSLKTSLKDKRQYQDSKLPVIQFEELKLISLKIAPPSNFSGSSPSSLAVSKNVILIGIRSGEVLVFNHSGNELKRFRAKKNFGQVTCMDITDDEIVAATGYHFGQVALWEIRTGKCIRACNTLHSTPVLGMKFWDGTFCNLITGELFGKVMMIEYGKTLLSTKISSYELFYDNIGSILSIERLVPDPNWPHPTDTSNLVALAGTSKIVIYNFADKHEIVCFIDKPENTPEGFYPCISWNRAYCPDDSEPIDHILAVAWGESITLYRFKFALNEGVQPAGYLTTDNEIKSIFWLNFEILCVLGKSREIRILTSKEMNKVPKKSPNDFKKAILDETYANRDIASQCYLKKDGREYFTFYNTFKCIDRSVMVLGNKDFQKGRLLNWKECIEELSKKNEWLEVLALGVDLYQGKGKKLYGLPRNKMELKGILEENVKKYVKVSLVAWVHKISNAIEFCIGIEALDLLFNELFDTFIDLGGPENMKIFMNTLEPFVLNKEIKSIPTGILGKMIGYYLNSKLPTVLERIILNLDPACIDPTHVLAACEEHNLLTAYIFISTNSQNTNFVQPLEKMYNLALNSKGIQEKFMIYKLLWYYKLCIKGQTFPSGSIPASNYSYVVSRTSIWVLEKAHFEFLLSQDPVTFLNTLFLLFSTPAALQVLCDSTPTYMDVINTLTFQRELSSYLFYLISQFILKTANIPLVVLDKSIYMRVIRYTLEGHKFNTASPIYASNIDQYICAFLYRNDVNPALEELSVEEKGSLLMQSLKKCGGLDASEISQLYSPAELSPYTEVQVYLLELKKEYATCVKYFIKCQSEIVRKKVFDWLDGVLEKISEADREKLKSEVMNCLADFVDIDSDATAQIVNDWYEGEHLEIVRKLDNAPKLQMKYLGELAKDALDEDLVFKYVVLLCENSKDQVLPFLSGREDYNIEDCLTQCLKHKVIEASAFLHEKLGNIQEALNLLLNRADENKSILSSKLKNREIIPKDLLDLIQSDIKKCIELCLRNLDRLDSTECEEHWFQVLKSILSFYKDFEEIFSFNPSLEPTVHNLIKEILEHMMSCVDFNKVIFFITKNFGNIPFKHFKDNIYQVLTKHSYQKNIVRQAISLLGSDVKGMTTSFYNLRIKGLGRQEVCSGCNVRIVSERVFHEKFIIFVCGHGFHARCNREHSCTVCFEVNKKKGELVFVGNRKRK